MSATTDPSRLDEASMYLTEIAPSARQFHSPDGSFHTPPSSSTSSTAALAPAPPRLWESSDPMSMDTDDVLSGLFVDPWATEYGAGSSYSLGGAAGEVHGHSDSDYTAFSLASTPSSSVSGPDRPMHAHLGVDLALESDYAPHDWSDGPAHGPALSSSPIPPSPSLGVGAAQHPAYKTLSLLSPSADQCIDLAELVGSSSRPREQQVQGLAESFSMESAGTVVPSHIDGKGKGTPAKVKSNAGRGRRRSAASGSGDHARAAANGTPAAGRAAGSSRGRAGRGRGRGGARTANAYGGAQTQAELAPSSPSSSEHPASPPASAHQHRDDETDINSGSSDASGPSEDEDDYEEDDYEEDADAGDGYSTVSSDYLPSHARTRHHPYPAAHRPRPAASASASSSTNTASRSGAGIPVPVPHLTKKSRGRKVPVVSSAAFFGPGAGAPMASSASMDVDVGSDLAPPAGPARGRRRRSGTGGGSGSGSGEAAARGRGGRMYRCAVEDCGKCFIRGEHLKRHVRSIHTNEKPHPCPFEGCQRTFSRRDNLGQHLRVHGLAL